MDYSTYYFEQNPFLLSEIIIYRLNENGKDDIVSSVNQANFNTDQECTDFCLFLCASMNKNTSNL